MKLRRATHLGLQQLEDRCTPAAAVYTAATQTLTVVAADGDQIDVLPIPGYPSSYLKVADSTATVFDSSTNAKAVRNLIVRFDGVNAGELNLFLGLRLGGNLSVWGARQSQLLANRGTVSGNFNYVASGNANDTLALFGVSKIGGNLNLGLGAGTNVVELRGGTIGGSLMVKGGMGDDHVELAENVNLSVGGSASFNLGGGVNFIEGKGMQVVDIGKDLTYVGGAGKDSIVTIYGGTTLQVGGNAAFTFGDSPTASQNSYFFDVHIGGNLSFLGGAHKDRLEFEYDLSVGGNFAVLLGGGDNNFDLNNDGAGLCTIGGNVKYVGGAGTDDVDFQDATVGKNVLIALGQSSDNYVTFGGRNNGIVQVHGSLTITGGAMKDDMTFNRLFVGNALTIGTGAGDDTIWMDDLDVAGPTSVDLGGGMDQLFIETEDNDWHGDPLSAVTNFGGRFTIRAGAGDDTVNFSDDMDGTTFIRFGDKVSLFSGAGNDTLLNVGNEFLVAGNFADFEAGAVP